MTDLIFKQTKNRNGKPSWFIYPSPQTGIHMGRVEWSRFGDRYVLNVTYAGPVRYGAAELRQIADFCEAQK